MLARARTALGALLVGLTVLGGVACSDRKPDEPAAEERAKTGGDRGGPSSLRASGDRFDGWRAPAAGWLAPFRERLDPLHAGWPTEQAALGVERLLGPALTRALAGAAGKAPAWIDERFEGATRLVPEALEEDASVRFDRGGLRVRLPEVPSPSGPLALEGAAAFAAELERWRGSLGTQAAPRVEVRAETSARRADGAYELELVVRAAAVGAARSVQDLARWRVAARVAPDGSELRLLRVELLAFQRAELDRDGERTVLLEDVTRAAFGAAPRFDDDLLRGNGARMGYLDKLVGEDLVGSHGVAVGDLDGDGLEDVYVAAPGGLPNLLFVKQPDGTVRQAGPESGLAFLDSTFGVLIVDLDGDGRRDVVAAVRDGVVVAWNEGDLRFVARPLPGGGAHRFYSLTAADADGDLDLDLYGCRYMAGAYVDEDASHQVPTPYHDAENGAPNLFWRNEGERGFVDATAEVGLDANNTRFSLSSIWEDVDDDGDLDLYVTNDFGRNNLYRNDGGRFTDVAMTSAADDMAASMGATMADVDRDGDLDLVVSNMYAPAGLRVSGQPAFLREHPELRAAYHRHAEGNSLLLNAGGGRFEDATAGAGIGPGGWSWGTKFVDLDDDGLDDLYVPNGFVTGAREEDLESYFWREVVGATPATPPATTRYDQAWKSLRAFMVLDGWGFNGRERNYAYLNLGSGRFADVSALSGADFRDDARCATTLDWNGDGRTDLLVRNRTGPGLRLLRNAFPAPGSWVELELSAPAPNTDAVGARVELDAGGQTFRRTVYAGDGYLGSSSKRLHVGLGAATKVDALRVRWPDGSEQAFGELEVRRAWRLARGGSPEPVARASFPALAAALMEGERSPPSRIVLADRLPMAPLTLRDASGGTLRVEALGGRPAVVVVGGFASEGERADLGALARGAAAADVGVVAVTMNADPGEAARVRGVLERARVEPRVVLGQQMELKIVQLLLLETLGEFDGVALPFALVLDAAGRLAAVHQAPASIEAVLADAAATRRPPADGVVGPVDPLLGGVWLSPPRRSLQMVAQVLGLLERPDLARAYEELERKRR